MVLLQGEPVALLLVVLSSFGTYGVRSWRYGYLLAPLVRVPFRRLLASTYAGFMAGLFVPRIGEVLRPWIVARRHPIPLSAAFAAIVLERVVDVAAILLLVGAGIAGSGGSGQLDAGWRGPLRAGGVLAAALAAATLLLLCAVHARPEKVRRGAAVLLRPLPATLLGKILDTIASFGAGLAVLRAGPVHLAVVAGQSLLVWIFVAFGIHASNHAFGVELPFAAALVVLGFLLVGVSLPTPGAVGGFHGAYVLALVTAFGVEAERAAAAALACHALTAVAVLVTGLALLPGEGLTLKQVTRPPAT